MDQVVHLRSPDRALSPTLDASLLAGRSQDAAVPSSPASLGKLR